MVELYLGDCLEEHIWIPDGSVDLVLTDLPYGTIKGLDLDSWDKSTTSWDDAIEPVRIFDIGNRILRKNGRLILFSQEPYTSKLITSAIPNLPFNYRMIWIKEHFANHLGCASAPVNYHEDIVVFTKKHELQNIHPLREYFTKVFNYIGLKKKDIIQKIGTRADHVFRLDSPQFSLCTEATYEALVIAFDLEFMEGFKVFDYLYTVDANHKRSYSSVFNLKGDKYKGSVLYYDRDKGSVHPTQKPVSLLVDLIETFSNPTDTIVDLTMGSGSTIEAAIKTNRKSIGIEKDPKWFKYTQNRTSETEKTE